MTTSAISLAMGILTKTPDTFTTMPWKNGGGTTHEIMKHEIAGKLHWRFSIAEVASDGPFSIFGGLSRILTVIEGEGLVLSAPQTVIEARPFTPVTFSGEWPIDCKRQGEHVTDFNVIFDAERWRAKVTIQPAGKTLSVTCAANQLHAALVLGPAAINGVPLPARSFIWLDDGALELKCDAPIIHTVLDLI